jgi:hypothetical protein
MSIVLRMFSPIPPPPQKKVVAQKGSNYKFCTTHLQPPSNPTGLDSHSLLQPDCIKMFAMLNCILTVMLLLLHTQANTNTLRQTAAIVNWQAGTVESLPRDDRTTSLFAYNDLFDYYHESITSYVSVQKLLTVYFMEYINEARGIFLCHVKCAPCQHRMDPRVAHRDGPKDTADSCENTD